MYICILQVDFALLFALICNKSYMYNVVDLTVTIFTQLIVSLSIL